MERETNVQSAPQANLSAYMSAVSAAEQRSFETVVPWLIPALALLGPLVVAVQRLEGATRIAVSAALLVPIVVASALQLRQEAANPAKPKLPFHGRQAGIWAFLTLFSFIGGFRLSWEADWESGISIAACSYLLAALGGTFCWRMAEKSTAAATAAPVAA